MDGRMEPLEKLFLQVEKESERRAQTSNDAITTTTTTTGTTTTTSRPVTGLSAQTDSSEASCASQSMSTTRRRGGSVTITHFGLLSATDRQNSTQSMTPSVIASRLPGFYQAHIDNDSFDSLIYGSNNNNNNDNDNDENDEAYHTEILDDDVVTQVFRSRSTARGSLTKAMGDLIPRRLSNRTNTEHGLSPNSATVIVGVQVEQATVEVSAADAEEPVRGATVHAPNSIRRRASSNNVLGSGSAWMAKARDLTMKIRQRSRTTLSPST